jgi:hypothetical protein
MQKREGSLMSHPLFSDKTVKDYFFVGAVLPAGFCAGLPAGV